MNEYATETNKRLDKIEILLESLQNILMTPKRLRPSLKPLRGLDVEDRAAEMIRVFNLASNLSNEKKKTQNFPQGTYNVANDRIEIMPRSILINRCQLRKAFRPTDEELGKKTATEIVVETLEKLKKEGELVEGRLIDAYDLGGNSSALCIFSPAWAVKSGLVKKKKPGKPAKWYPGWEKEWDGFVDEVPQDTQSPLESKTANQETLSVDVDAAREAQLIREMQQAEQEGQLSDNVIFERQDDERRISL